MVFYRQSQVNRINQDMLLPQYKTEDDGSIYLYGRRVSTQVEWIKLHWGDDSIEVVRDDKEQSIIHIIGDKE